MRSVDQFRCEKLPVRDIRVLGLELAHLANVVQLLGHKRAVGIAFAVNESQDGLAVLPAVFTSQPYVKLAKSWFAG